VFEASPHGAITSAEVADLVQLETQLSVIMYSASQNHDIDDVYNNRSVAEARAMLGALAGYLDAFGLDDSESVNVAQLGYFAALEAVVQRRSFATQLLYAKLRLFAATFGMLGAEQRATSTAYREMVYGTSVQTPRDEACVNTVSRLLPSLTGYYFVQRVNSSVEEAERILEAVERSYSDNFASVSWMDTATADAANAKLEAITNLVGYPSVWDDFNDYYSSESIDFSDYFELVLSLSATSQRDEFAQRTEPVDKSVWSMSPADVNAYYSPSFNLICFPMGILQAPFYSPDNVAAMNYGGIGVVQGHELGHAFDNSGSRYDAHGYLRDWWTPASRESFDVGVECVEDQYSSYSVTPGVNVVGSLVVGEAMADLGGVSNAYSAYKNSGIDEVDLVNEAFGMSPDELFFVAFAQIWCNTASPGYLEMLTSTNPHPPGEYRVQGTLSDSADFHEVFQCAAGSTYNPATSCDIW